mmetsp:Transcript_140700/g.350776  ORF Transcript_140700/g.350776 Transcript_140700/m.350776 type:complete len:583 (-) Transcript_140700:38-1786(-)
MHRLGLLVVTIKIASLRVATTSTTDDFSLAGNPLCPCLNLTGSLRNRSITPPGTSPEMSEGYGFGCGYHDNSTAAPFRECASSSPPDWCVGAWCYVDREHCTLLHRQGGVRVGLDYSYATCGFLDTFHERNTATALQGTTLKITQMMNGYGWMGSYCTRRNRCSGPINDIFDAVAKDTGAAIDVTWTFVGRNITEYPNAYPLEVMAEFRRRMPSSTSIFHPCVIATGMGYVDACIGAFYLSYERFHTANFVKLWNDPTYLITTYDNKKVSRWEQMVVAFKPFKPGTWAVLGGLVVLISILISIVEFCGAKARRHAFRSPEVRVEFRKSLAWDGFYQGILSFASAASVWSPEQRGARIMNIAFSFMILLALSSYTANLTMQLVTGDDKVTPISSIDDIIKDPTLKICGHSARRLENLGVPEGQRILGKTTEDLMRAIGSECVAGELTLEQFTTARRHGDFCHLVRIGEPLNYMTWGFPVSQRAYRTFAALFTDAEQTGYYEEIFRRYRAVDQCLLQGNRHPTEDDDEGLEVEDVVGPVCFVGAIVLCGACVQILPACLKRCYKHRDDHDEDSGESAGTPSAKE